jgi:magnesium transporter
MISIFCWRAAEGKAQSLEPGALLERKDDLHSGSCVLWVDLADPTPEEEKLVFEDFFHIHPLTLEDITRPRRLPNSPPHFPKVEEFSDYLFVIINPLSENYLDRLRTADGQAGSPARSFAQLSAVLTHHMLITHHGPSLVGIRNLQAFLERHETQAQRGPDYLFHLILDSTVDQYAPVLDFFDDVLDDMEQRVIQRPRPALYMRLLKLKRQIILLRKTLIYEREILVRLSRGEFGFIEEREAVYYRNVYDHLVRFAELIEASREMASDLMQSYLASVSNRLNEIMKVLTMISTVVLPMTLIAGIYGMNFTHMPEIDWPWGYPFALFLMLLTGVVSFIFFRWKKWI